jgi:hypothetical protein
MKCQFHRPNIRSFFRLVNFGSFFLGLRGNVGYVLCSGGQCRNEQDRLCGNATPWERLPVAWSEHAKTAEVAISMWQKRCFQVVSMKEVLRG